ncbi:hypothetical protein FHS27_005347 [Rhodopirellula rubra]|uniref:Uncharacterized protein n=1 Tax=Aporhodopirellula rubra TaxID=980271 RepID=A0A7W5E552_9BACT|nr:DUF5989 family protein [Aporhodopirellula rubra]MBB3209507.1 hypothetical protein [Aporhodopirellula rubra]
MADEIQPRESEQKSEFEREAARDETGIVREFVQFLVENKKWWLAPLIGSLLLLGLISLLAAGGAAPFIYTLF